MKRLKHQFPAVGAASGSPEIAHSIGLRQPPVAARGGDIYTVKAVWNETGRTEVLKITNSARWARATAREHSKRTRWFSAVYVTNGQPGILAAFKQGRPV